MFKSFEILIKNVHVRILPENLAYFANPYLLCKLTTDRLNLIDIFVINKAKSAIFAEYSYKNVSVSSVSVGYYLGV